LKVLLLGYYGYGNFGDELMRMSIEDFFAKFKIDYTIALPKRISRDTVSRFSLLEMIDATFDSDMLVYGGGGLLQDITSTKSFIYYASVIRLSLLLNKPVILFGNSLGPVKKAIDRYMLRSILKNKKVYVFARDLISYRYAKYLNQNAVLSCDPSVRYLKKVALDKEKVEKKYDLILIPKKSEDAERYNILKKYFENIIICPSQETDIPVSKKIAKNLNCELFEDISNIDDVLTCILSSKFIISERFHPSLVGGYFGIPFISLENSKAERFFRRYTDRKEIFTKNLTDVGERIEKVKKDPIRLKEIMDKEAEESYKQLFKLMIRLKND